MGSTMQMGCQLPSSASPPLNAPGSKARSRSAGTPNTRACTETTGPWGPTSSEDA